MCEFLSWIELPNGELKYISDFELGTREGVKLKKFLGERYSDEIVGHGAIKTYFGLKHGAGKDCECVDFSTPDNFEARRLAWEEYWEAEGLAEEEYRKVVGLAKREYHKAERLAWEKYKKAEGPALKKYKKAERLAFWKLFANLKNRPENWR